MGSDNSPYETITFCSISKGKDIVFFYSADGGNEVENLASIWLEKAPELHLQYSHSAEKKTIAMLKEDGHTFLAINEPSTGNLITFMFLKSFIIEFKKVANKKDFKTELDSAIHHLTTPECLPPPPMQTHHMLNSMPKASDRSSRGSTHDRKKLRDRGSNAGSTGEGNSDSGLKIDVALESSNGVSPRRSPSSKVRHQQYLRKLWWQHVKIVLAIDAVMCLLLLAAWLMICRGFQCLP